MAQYPNLGGMLTQAGARQGQQLGQAFTGLGQNLMKPVDNLLARKKNEGLQKEVQDFLAANKDDPAALNAEAARYTTMGKNDIARVFTEAAQRAVDNKAKAADVTAAQGSIAAISSNDPVKLRAEAAKLAKIPGKQQDALELLKMAQEIEDKQNKGRTDRGLQGGLTAITQASSKLHNARLAKDSKAVQEAAAELKEAKGSIIGLGGTAEQIRNAEEAGKSNTSKETGFTLSPGSKRFEKDESSPTGYREVASAPTASKEDPTKFSDELIKGGKYTPESIQDAQRADGSVDYSKLVPTSKDDTPSRGNVNAPTAKRYSQIEENSTKASVSLSRNRALQQSLITQPGKSEGIVSDLRTSALNLAGLRDAEEETKTQFLRTRNTDIINSLPPGVASDTDVRIFSQGFPSENASTEEITRYLQAEEKILASVADIALVADTHLQTQIDAGLDATMVGFESKKQNYGTIMSKAMADMEAQTANAQTEQEAIEIEQRIISQVAEVLGFVPKFYR